MDHFSGSTTSPLLVRAVEAMADQLKSVRDSDPTFLSAAEKSMLLAGLLAVRNQTEALLVDVLAVGADVADLTAARTPAAWVAVEGRDDRAALGRLQRLADTAVLHPAVSRAMRDGAVNPRQGEVIVAAVDALGADVAPIVRAQAEEWLIGQAAEFGPAELRQLGRRVLEVIDPEACDDAERKRLEDELSAARRATRLSLRPMGEGATRISGVIPDAVAARLKTYLDAFSSPRHDAVAAGGSGDPSAYVDPATGRRLPAARVLGEAFGDFLEAADPARMPLHGGTATQVIVTIEWDKLLAGVGVGLAEGEPIPVSEVRRLACQAGVLPAVLGGHGEVLDLGRSRRLFTTAQRKALMLRYPVCAAEGCDCPASWCEAHHLEPWSKGGRTDLADGVLLCPRHHRAIHDGRYAVTALPGGGLQLRLRT